MSCPQHKLYTFKPSLWAGVPRLLIAERSIPNVEQVVVDLSKAENYAPEYLKVNPNATIPTLEVTDGQDSSKNMVLTDSISIAAYLDKLSGNTLSPPGKQQEIDALLQEMHGRYDLGNQVFMTAGSPAELEAKRPLVLPFLENRIQAWQAYAARAPEHRPLYEKLTGHTAAAVAVYTGAVDPTPMFSTNRQQWEAVVEFLNKIESRLQEEGPYLFGSYTIADIHFTPYLHRLVMVKAKTVFEDRPALKLYYEQVQQRESFGPVFG
ncbi:hypothetical protein DFQ28_010817 [Apophysomyces sp. BC1034]|nr:hypothetical protein DFQ30_010570 [Apophysomyces sp. BC1015]KAG0170212.1 hypothetical protein DFQ29_009370 [Apophysomyces sp. BC1021]KAG0184622.1 hypothetical protein DFQ28_010817 [Apophysomyces sp. BC1034]